MTVTLRNSRDAEDIHLQNNFWIQLREIIAFCQRFAYVFRYHPCHLLGTARTLAKSLTFSLVPKFPSMVTASVTEMMGHDNLGEELQIHCNSRSPVSKCHGNDRMAVQGLRV
jgi:hypothetical protein